MTRRQPFSTMIMQRIHLQALAVPTVRNTGTFLPAVHGGALPPGVRQGPVYARKEHARSPRKLARENSVALPSLYKDLKRGKSSPYRFSDRRRRIKRIYWVKLWPNNLCLFHLSLSRSPKVITLQSVPDNTINVSTYLSPSSLRIPIVAVYHVNLSAYDYLQ